MKEKTLSSELLSEFYDLITKKKSDAENNLTFLKNQREDELKTSSPDLSVLSSNLQLQTLAKDTITNCNNAFARIKNKTFGVDFCSKELIPIEQLKANPFLTRTIKQPVSWKKL